MTNNDAVESLKDIYELISLKQLDRRNEKINIAKNLLDEFFPGNSLHSEKINNQKLTDLSHILHYPSLLSYFTIFKSICCRSKSTHTNR